MTKKHPRPSNETHKVDIEVESWQWQTGSSQRFTWKHALILAVILAFAILLAFGFLVVASIVLVVGVILNLVIFLLRKLS